MKILGSIACCIALAVPVHAATIAYYEFNGTGVAPVGTVIPDLAGSHDGTVTGGDLVFGSDPVLGSYLSFAADAGVGNPGNRVVIPGAADLTYSLTQDYTIELIFRTTQPTTNGILISKGADVSNPDTQWWIRHQGNGQLRADMEGNGGNGIEDNATSPTGQNYEDGQWHNVALVYVGTAPSKHLDIYVDGLLRASDTSIGTLGTSGGVDTDPVIIGEFASLAANRSFAGDIAAVRFSDAALTSADFLQVPEPSSLALGALVGGALACYRRRKP